MLKWIFTVVTILIFIGVAVVLGERYGWCEPKHSPVAAMPIQPIPFQPTPVYQPPPIATTPVVPANTADRCEIPRPNPTRGALNYLAYGNRNFVMSTPPNSPNDYLCWDAENNKAYWNTSPSPYYRTVLPAQR